MCKRSLAGLILLVFICVCAAGCQPTVSQGAQPLYEATTAAGVATIAASVSTPTPTPWTWSSPTVAAPTPTTALVPTPTPVKNGYFPNTYLSGTENYIMLDDVQDFSFAVEMPLPHNIPKDYYHRPGSECARSPTHNDDYLCQWRYNNRYSQGNVLNLNVWFRQETVKWRPGSASGVFVQIWGPDCYPQWYTQPVPTSEAIGGYNRRHKGWSCRIEVSSRDNNIDLGFLTYDVPSLKKGDTYRIELIAQGDTATLRLGDKEATLAVHRSSSNSSDLVFSLNGPDRTLTLTASALD